MLAVKQRLALLAVIAIALAALAVQPTESQEMVRAHAAAPGAPRNGTFRGKVSAVGVFRQSADPLRYLVVGRWEWVADARPRERYGLPSDYIALGLTDGSGRLLTGTLAVNLGIGVYDAASRLLRLGGGSAGGRGAGAYYTFSDQLESGNPGVDHGVVWFFLTEKPESPDGKYFLTIEWRHTWGTTFDGYDVRLRSPWSLDAIYHAKAVPIEATAFDRVQISKSAWGE